MPVTWTTEADLTIVANLLGMRDIKATGAEKTELAALVGNGCTAKAITHRLAHIKSMATGGTKPSTGGTIDPATATTGKANTKVSKGALSKKAKNKGATDAEHQMGNGEEEAADEGSGSAGGDEGDLGRDPKRIKTEGEME